MCTTGDTAHSDMIFKFLPHTRQRGRIDILHCYSDQNEFSTEAAIFSLHTLASPSGRNVNYDEKQLTEGDFLTTNTRIA